MRRERIVGSPPLEDVAELPLASGQGGPEESRRRGVGVAQLVLQRGQHRINLQWAYGMGNGKLAMGNGRAQPDKPVGDCPCPQSRG